MALAEWKPPAILSRNAHLRPTHIWKAVEGLTQVGTRDRRNDYRGRDTEVVERFGEPAGTRTQGPRLKRSKVGFTQGLGFATVSPFFLCEQGLEMILYIPLIL